MTLQETIANASSFPKITLGKWWRGIPSLPQDVKAGAVRAAEKDWEEGLGEISLALWREFSLTGDRARFEKVYFHRRKTLSDLVVAELCEGKGRFVPMAEEAIWTLLSEPAWAIPAHNSYVRDTPHLDTPLLERPILDLFACETGEILALAKLALKDKLNPTLVQDIDWALHTRITVPYLTDHFWWMGGEGDLNNWSPWCTQNTLIAVLSEENATGKDRRKAVRQAASSLDAFLATYGDDGACDEGASYWHAAALALWGALEVLSECVGESAKDILSTPKLRGMCRFVEEVWVGGDTYLNFADCSPKAGMLKGREYIFAKATGNADMAAHAAHDVIASGWGEEENDYNLFYKFAGLTALPSILREGSAEPVSPKDGSAWFERTQMLVCKRDGVVFAAKGGNNGESHNHNDLGSLILYKDGKCLLADIGVETYTKTTFGPDRYTLKPMRSPWHNTVNFPPLEQLPGKERAAKLVSRDENSVEYDLTWAYPAGKGLRSYRRKASFLGDRIQVVETIDSDLEAELTLVTVERPRCENIGNEISFDSFKVTFAYSAGAPGGGTIESEVMEITDARLRNAWPEKLYRTRMRAKGSFTWVLDMKKGEKK